MPYSYSSSQEHKHNAPWEATSICPPGYELHSSVHHIAPLALLLPELKSKLQALLSGPRALLTGAFSTPWPHPIDYPLATLALTQIHSAASGLISLQILMFAPAHEADNRANGHTGRRERSRLCSKVPGTHTPTCLH